MRAIRRTIIVLVILFGLFVAADRIAVHVAQSQVADKLQTARGLAQKPSVSIEGFPFLTQLAGGKLDEVKVHATGMTVHGTSGGPNVTLQDFEADLKGVRLENDYSTAVADTATGTAVISYADLTAALPSHPALSYGGDSKVKVSATVDLPFFGKQALSGTADVNVVNGDTIGLADISGITGGDSASALGVAALQAAGAMLEPQFRLSGLPSGLKLARIQAEPDGIAVSVSGTGVSLSSTSD
ncbi:DUF2993 domain-containing protein [Streptacidiphilus sp. PB12-B1b]|uniref:LmeA family phospholipid-binding protein n=1 Tax=Streptacidiphilus sp. PB12-B1b TaxID=2705012 RepID=UPI0015FBB00D|nr:DUF2993 domain-containing protein [Streptacidiphilus sp. PB12-B1b]QMU79628.1 DUF2993 domain-containing protein [Streptacidiphilus sp. PB12-B1b]